jgi:uncharacterized protein (TIGR01244 family)
MIYRAIQILILLAVIPATYVAADGSRETVGKMDMPGIVNYTIIDGSSGVAGPSIGFGGATEPSAMAELKEQGFTTVINLRLATEDEVDIEASRLAAEKAGLSYIHLPFDTAEPASGVVDEFIRLVGASSNQPVYVHCGSATRAAGLWMISRVLEDGWTPEQAASEARQVAGKPEAAVEFANGYLDSH